MYIIYTLCLSYLAESTLSLAYAMKGDNNVLQRPARQLSPFAKPDSRNSIAEILFKWPFMPVNASRVGEVCLTCFSSGRRV